MSAHVRTTVDISSDLLRQAKAVASRERTTLSSLLEEGLLWALSKRRQRQKFELRNASVGGKGVRPGIDDTDWSSLSSKIYEGRGS